MSRTVPPHGGHGQHGLSGQEEEGEASPVKGLRGAQCERPADPSLAGLTPAGASKTLAEATRPGQLMKNAMAG